MKNTDEGYEINLFDVGVIILNNKLKIFFGTLLVLAITSIYLINKPIQNETYFAKTIIKPLGFKNDNKYRLYNSYVELLWLKESMGRKDVSSKKYFQNINSKILFDLYIFHLKEKVVFEEAIINLNILKKEDYVDDVVYREAAENLAHKIKIIESENFIRIEFKFDNNIADWEKLLSYTHNSINKIIQNYITDIFNQIVNNQKIFLSFKIEDINDEILNNQGNETFVKDLINKKLKLKNDKKLARLEEFFNKTPVKLSSFNAAEIDIKSTQYTLTTKFMPKRKIFILAGLFGLLLSIIYVLISHKINNKIQDNLN